MGLAAPRGWTRTAFGFKKGAVKLWAVALLAAATLSGAEATFDGRRDVLAEDQANHIVLSASMAEGLLDMSFPPRVSPILDDGLGNPFHQFYSPLAHGAVAAGALVLGDLIDGFTSVSVFLLALAFVYSFKLGRYLTLSDRCAALAAFLFVTAPYFSTDRVLRGAFAEYFAFALLPMATYYNLRALPLASLRLWALAALSTAALLHAHLITGVFFLFFYAVVLLLAVACALARRAAWRKASGSAVSGPAAPSGPAGTSGSSPASGTSKPPGPPPRVWPFARKALAAGSVAAGAIVLSMWYMGPVLFYGDLVIKSYFGSGASTASSGYMTPVLGFFSLTDSSWNFRSNLEIASRFQAGVLPLASYGAFLYFLPGRRSSWALPFALSAGLVLFVIASPEAFLLPPLKYIDIAQFPYRLLSLFTLAAAAAGALALKAFFARSPGFSPASRSVASMVLIALAFASGVPYVYPRTIKDISPLNMDTGTAYSVSRLVYSQDAYLRVPPADGAPPGLWTDPGRAALGRGGKAGDWSFEADLGEYYRASGGPEGEVLLDVLYYPGLQDIEVSVDGKKVALALGTYWQKRDPLDSPVHLSFFVRRDPVNFHGLRISGAPDSGAFKARVRFVGFRWANLTTAGAAALLLGALAASAVRRARRRARLLQTEGIEISEVGGKGDYGENEKAGETGEAG
ncbi:MAG: hypothetical protein LBQ12_00615 [Deltaproteobacteria bacterium]|jgi:hypothetical protein|nr:hypothetical protein [Deltaproteobacteria bacterium]